MANSANTMSTAALAGAVSNPQGYVAGDVAGVLRMIADEIEGRQGEAIGSMMADETVAFIERLGKKYEEFLHQA